MIPIITPLMQRIRMMKPKIFQGVKVVITSVASQLDEFTGGTQNYICQEPFIRCVTNHMLRNPKLI